MLPQGETGIKTDVRQQPSRTYAIVGNRNVGMVDGLEAVKQAVFKMLQTNRFEHLIYSSNYGNELTAVLGSDPSAARARVTKQIKGALLSDDRIRSIEGLQVAINGGAVSVSFTVVSQYGSFQTGVNMRNV